MLLFWYSFGGEICENQVFLPFEINTVQMVVSIESQQQFILQLQYVNNIAISLIAIIMNAIEKESEWFLMD